jgi:hypothetical protein
MMWERCPFRLNGREVEKGIKGRRKRNERPESLKQERGGKKWTPEKP